MLETGYSCVLLENFKVAAIWILSDEFRARRQNPPQVFGDLFLSTRGRVCVLVSRGVSSYHLLTLVVASKHFTFIHSANSQSAVDSLVGCPSREGVK